MTKALELAAQCWCDKRVEDRVMDVGLATVVAETIDAARRDVWEKMRRYCVAAVSHPDNHDDLICYEDGPNHEKDCDYSACPLIAEKD